MKAFTNAVFILFLCGSIFAAGPLAVDDLHLTAVNTSRICYPLVNDSDADGDILSLQSFESTSTGGGAITDNGDGTLNYSPSAGFVGLDTFGYTVTDGGISSSGTVSISVNATFNAESARTAILSGVSTLADPGGASGCVAYGPTAYSIGHYGGENRSDPMIAASTLGNGRVLAMPDHQWLKMGNYGGSADTGVFYLNAIEWLTGTSSKNIKIVVTNVDSNNADTWLVSQGFTNVVRSNNYVTELADADLLVGWLGSGLSQSDVDAVIDFARNGGGLFLADYGIGYIWWWYGTGVVNAPGNRVLRQAGIGFAKEGGGSLAVGRSSGQTTSEDVIDMLDDSSGYSSTDLDIGGTVMGRIFDILPEGDNLLARLDEKFHERIDTIMPSPSTPVSDSFDKALLRRESAILLNTPVEEIIAHRTAEAVYGAIPPGASRVSPTISFNVSQKGIDTRGNNSGIWLSTGLYAVPGEIVTVNVSSGVRSLGLRVKINGDWNDISARGSYLRIPFGTSTEFALDQANVQAANPFGGLIYITIPSNTIPGAFDATISNAIEAPFFVLGVNTNAEWISTLRDKPGPYAELVSGNMIISVPKYQITDLDKAEELMTFWHDGVASQDDLGGWTGRRTRAMRMYSMVQTAWGSGYAGYPIGGWGWDFGDYQALEAGGCWGAYHETGHWHQSGYWTDGRTGEVTVNIFTMCAIEAVCDSGKASDGWSRMWDPAQRVGMYENSVAAGGFDGIGVGDRLGLYMQLRVAFGWGAFKNTFQTYLDDEVSSPGALPTTDQQEWDQFMTRFSRQVGYDLSPFFVDWDYGVSQGAINSLSDLPAWNMLETLTDYYSVASGGSITITDPAVNDYSFEGGKTFVSMGTAENGVLVDNGNGTWTYTPDGEFEGTETISYTVRNGYGSTFSGSIVISVTGKELVAYYTFDNDDVTGSTVKDMSGPVKYNATNVSAASGYAGHTEQGFSFNGSYSYVAIPALNLNSNTVTMTAWVKRNGTQSSYAGILFSRAGSTTAGMNFRGTTHELGYHWNGTASSYNFASGLEIRDNKWTFIALVVEPYKATLYVNGQSAVNNVSHSIEESDSTTNIGRDYSYRSYKGLIDEVSIWNRALGSNEISDLYNHGRAMSNSLPMFPDPFDGEGAIEGVAYQSSLASVVTDPEGDPLEFTKISGPAWLSIASNGTVSGTPDSADIGTESVTIEAVDELDGIQQAVMSIEIHNLYKGDMGLDDFAQFASKWLKTGCVDFPPCGGSDLSGDGDVDIEDMLVFCEFWLN